MIEELKKEREGEYGGLKTEGGEGENITWSQGMKTSHRGWGESRQGKMKLHTGFLPSCLNASRCIFPLSVLTEVKLLPHQITTHMSLNYCGCQTKQSQSFFFCHDGIIFKDENRLD